jgi:tetratricopeptide (TPR) repeat protein
MEFMYYKGLCLTKLGRYNEALHYLEQVVNSDLGFLYIYQSRMILGYIYSVTDRFKLAEYEFNKLLTEGVESVQIYSLLGYVAYSQNKIPQSISFLKKALKIDANYPNALNCLGFIYAEKNIDTVEAIILCKKAVNLKPENYAYLDSLGWAYYKNNQTQQARTYLGKALDLAPDNPEIINHIQILMNKTS